MMITLTACLYLITLSIKPILVYYSLIIFHTKKGIKNFLYKSEMRGEKKNRKILIFHFDHCWRFLALNILLLFFICFAWFWRNGLWGCLEIVVMIWTIFFGFGVLQFGNSKAWFFGAIFFGKSLQTTDSFVWFFIHA
jgi:hypothetical protein